MTACAMIVGMVPMALALEAGSQMEAPLGRAVIGGLVVSTFATLLIVPAIFRCLMGRSVARSPSLYPDDPESPHYDPDVVGDPRRNRIRPVDHASRMSRGRAIHQRENMATVPRAGVRRSPPARVLPPCRERPDEPRFALWPRFRRPRAA